MDRNELEKGAARWIAKCDRSGRTPQLERDLAVWLNQSTAHRVTYFRLANAWRQADRLRAADSEPPGTEGGGPGV